MYFHLQIPNSKLYIIHTFFFVKELYTFKSATGSFGFGWNHSGWAITEPWLLLADVVMSSLFNEL